MQHKLLKPSKMDDIDTTGLRDAEPYWFLYDSNGMILPHSILGSKEHFRSYVEARGELGLLEKIPNSGHPFEVNKRESNVVGDQRKKTQEGREMPIQVLPLVHSGYGHCVGSGFWRLPQRYGDETSGIASTLTKTERGVREPVLYFQDNNKLEVTGSSKPFGCQTCSNASSTNTNKEEDPTVDDIILKSNDVEPDSKHLPVPALRISGQLANWTGNSNANQGQVGINTTILFESLTGKLQMSHIEIHNEGSTAIFYTWERRPLPHHFPHLLPRTLTPECFYFNSSSGVILPGETQIVKCSFKSGKPGLQTELWQLNTHPILLQGAPIQVTLRGVALYQDRAAEHRLYIEKKLEKQITVQVCRSIVSNLVKGIDTPERPGSPAELCETEEQEFLRKNPKLTDPSPVTVAALGQQMWRELVDTMASEAVRLTHLLHLPEKDTWMDKKENKKEVLSDQEVTASLNEEKSSKKGDVEKTMVKSKKKVAPVKHEDRKNGKERRTDLGKPRKDGHNKEADLQLKEEAPEELASDTNMTNIYTRVLHQKTYGLIENLVESLCDVIEELKLPTDITL